MSTETPPLQPEREQTDESLRAERERADRALAEAQRAINDDAVEEVDHARGDADAVLSEARGQSDEKLARIQSQTQARRLVVEERAREDEALRKERAATDESLRLAREQHARALAALLPLERDRTDRHLLTERARADGALAHRDDFLSMVSHDLRNLLGGILHSVELLADDTGGAAPQEAVDTGIKRVRRYAARMNRLIGDLIDVAGIDAGQLTVSTNQGDWTALITEAIEVFRPAAAEKGISLQAEIVAGSPEARFDHERMLQVLANLISNAIKFTERGGKIRVRGERVGDELRIHVSDTGEGIPEGLLEAVFERFWQVHEKDRRGMGLGLYISRHIVEAHGGKIWAESTMGEGSRFCLTLPCG